MMKRMLQILNPVQLVTSKLTRSHQSRPFSRLSSALMSRYGDGGTKEDDNQAELHVEQLIGDCAGTTVIGLNRAKAKNALSKTLLHRLSEVIATLKAENSLRVVILRSLVPGVFCAGADLKERSQMKEAEVRRFLADLRQLLMDLHTFPVPTIAALDGVAVGGGLEISLTCDMRVAASTARLGLVETKLAIIPGGGGTQNLPRLINPAVAKELIFTGRVLDGEQAKQLGIVNHCVPQNEAGDAAFLRAVELAKEIVPQGPIALRMAKQAINSGLQADLTTGLSIEQMCYAQVIPTKDRVEGLNAFKEKRVPVYKGE